MPDPLLSVLLSLPSQSSYNYPMLIPNVMFANPEGSKDKMNTIINVAVKHGVPLAISRYFKSEEVDSQYSDDEFLSSYDQSFAYGFGFDGFSDRVQVSDN